MPFGARWTFTWVATFSACHNSLCAVSVMSLYSRLRKRQGGPGDDALATSAAPRGRQISGVPARGLWAFHEPAAGICRSFLCLLCLDFLRDHVAAGVERNS